MKRTYYYLKEALMRNYFLIALLFIYTLYILRFSTLSYNSEVWAEHGTNYLYNAYNNNFWNNLWTPDAGYLVWFPRIIALLVSYISSPYYFIYITNFIGLLVIAFCASFINHKGFRDIIPSDKIRFLLSIILGGLIFPNYENFTYVNFSYHGIVFCALLFFINKDILSKKELCGFSILSAFFCISKFHFVMFLPILLIYLIWYLYHKKTKYFLFFLPSAITVFIQIFYVLLISSQTKVVKGFTVVDEGAGIIFLNILKGIFYWLQAYVFPLKYFLSPIASNITGTIILISYITTIVVMWRKKRISSFVLWCIFVLNVLAIGYSSISSLGHLKSGKMLFSIVEFHFNRLNFMTYILSYIAAFIFFDNIKNKKRDLLFSIIILIIYLHPGKFSDRRRAINTASNWNNYHTLFSKNRFCIPVNPPLWAGGAPLAKGCHFIKEYKNVSDYITLHDKGVEKYKILAVLIDYPKNEKIHIEVYNRSGVKIAKGKMLSDENIRYKYIVFNEGISAYKLHLLNHKNKSLSSEKVILYGYE